MIVTTVHIYIRLLLETVLPGRKPIEFSAGLVGHANAEHRTHAEKRIGLVGWSAVTSRYKRVSSSGKCAVWALTLTHGPHPLCLGRVLYMDGG